jgi:hypothetical protein
MQEAQPAAPAAPVPPSPQSLGEQIRTTVEQQVQAARAQAAAAAAAQQDESPPLTPTVVVRPGGFDEIPPQAVDISLMFFVTVFAIIVGFPIARAIGRWIDRRGHQPRIAPDITTQLNQIAQSVDAMAIEVERISEGQRFTTRLLADQQANRSSLPAGGHVPPT